MKEAKVIVPTSLSEITLGQYQDYSKSIDGLDQEQDVDEINKLTIEHFCTTDYSDILEMPMNEYNIILEIIRKAFTVKPQFKNKFTMGNIKYGFIPKLDNMSLGEYVDLESSFGDWENMHQAMAVLYRPIAKEVKDKYGIIPYDPNEDVIELMKGMPLDVVMGSTVFFYNLGKDLSIATLSFLEKAVQSKDLEEPLKKALEKNGGGINQFMASLRETSEGLTKSLDYQYINA
jgi:hypothetical protein